MSLMVEPNIVFLAQYLATFGKIMTSSKNTCQNADFLCISKFPINNYLRAKFCDPTPFESNFNLGTEGLNPVGENFDQNTFSGIW